MNASLDHRADALRQLVRDRAAPTIQAMSRGRRPSDWPDWAPPTCFVCSEPITPHDLADLGRGAGEKPSRGAIAVLLYGQPLARHTDCLPAPGVVAELVASVREPAGTGIEAPGPKVTTGTC